MSATERPYLRPTPTPLPAPSGLKLPAPEPPRFSLSFKIFFAAAPLILITVGGYIAISAARSRAIADAKIADGRHASRAIPSSSQGMARQARASSAGASLNVAVSFFRRQEPRWPATTAVLVEEARNSLAGRIW